MGPLQIPHLAARGPPPRVNTLDWLYIQSYTRSCDFEWDDAKSDANLTERGFDFEFASLIFNGPTLEREDRRKDYGERRVVATGTADGIHLTVVYTDRQGSDEEILRRIISAHRSNRRERTRYEKASK